MVCKSHLTLIKVLPLNSKIPRIRYLLFNIRAYTSDSSGSKDEIGPNCEQV